MSRESIFAEINSEREAQDKEYGGPEEDQRYDEREWIMILTKHIGRAVTRFNSLELFRRQMLIVASVGVAAMEWVDRQLGENTGKDMG